MHVIIEEGLADQEFIAERTENYEYLASVVEDSTPEKVAEITGVEAAKIKKAARLLLRQIRQQSILQWASLSTELVQIMCFL